MSGATPSFWRQRSRGELAVCRYFPSKMGGHAAGPAPALAGAEIEIMDPEDSKWYPAFVESRLEDGSCMATHEKGNFMYTCRHYMWRMRKSGASRFDVDGDADLDEDEEEEDDQDAYIDSLKMGQKISVAISSVEDDGCCMVKLNDFKKGLLRPARPDEVIGEPGDTVDAYFLSRTTGGLVMLATTPPELLTAELKVGQRVHGFLRREFENFFFVNIGAEKDGVVRKTAVKGKTTGDEADFIVSSVSGSGKFTLDVDTSTPPVPGAKISVNITGPGPDGFFVSLGHGRRGLLRATPKDKLKIGQQLDVFVTSVDGTKVNLDLARRLPVANITVGQRFNGTVVQIASGFGLFVDVGAERNGLVRHNAAGNLSVGDSREFEVTKLAGNQRGQTVFELKHDESPSSLRWKDLKPTDKLQARVVEVNNGSIYVDIGAGRNFLARRLHHLPAPKPSEEIPVWVSGNAEYLTLSYMEVTVPVSQLEVGAKLRGKIVELRPWGANVDIGTGDYVLLKKSAMDPPVLTGNTSDVVKVGQETEVWVTGLHQNKDNIHQNKERRDSLVTVSMREFVPLDSIEPGQVHRGVIMSKKKRTFIVNIGSSVYGHVNARSAKLQPGHEAAVRVLNVTNKTIAMVFADADAQDVESGEEDSSEDSAESQPPLMEDTKQAMEAQILQEV